MASGNNLLHSLLQMQAAGQPTTPAAAAATPSPASSATASTASPTTATAAAATTPSSTASSSSSSSAAAAAAAVATPTSGTVPAVNVVVVTPQSTTSAAAAAATAAAGKPAVDSKVDAKTAAAAAAAASSSSSAAAAGRPVMIHKESETANYAIDPKSGLKIDPKTGKKLDPKIVLKPKPSDMAVSVVYWEKQEAALCAVHACNNLLQANYVNEWDMSQIAQKLTEDERKLMAEMGTETRDFLQFAAADSQHVDDSGNFSIEVIKRTLERIGLQCHSLSSEHGKAGGKDPLTENAFICNLNDHWLAIRKLGGHYFNLNSLNNAGPMLITEFYLSAYMQQLTASGYSIFVVRGDPISKPKTNEVRRTAQWQPISDILARKGKDPKKGGGGGGGKRSNKEQDDIDRAMRDSMKDATPKPKPDSDLERAMKASLAEAKRNSAAAAGSRAQPMTVDDGDDLARALSLSLQPPTPNSATAAAAAASARAIAEQQQKMLDDAAAAANLAKQKKAQSAAQAPK